MATAAHIAPLEHKEDRPRAWSDENWVIDPVAYDAAKFAAIVLLDCATPASAKHRGTDEEADKDMGRHLAFGAVQDLIRALNGKDIELSLGRGSHTGPVRRLIGPMAPKMKERLKESARLLVDSTPVTDGARRRA
jgi:hypothetical protein